MDLEEELKRLRREFHRFPEPSFAEYKTGDRIAEYLSSLGMEVERFKTAVVGTVGEGSPVIALRADMDALSLTEERDSDYKSENPGFMHACGHDGHMTMVLGAAILLAKKQLPGKIKFIFQPAEEKVKGADFLIESGVIDEVDEIFGLHLMPDFPAGEVYLKKGPAMATSDLFELTVLGQAGHGARPDLGKNAILMASQVINAVLCFTGQFSPLETAVVNFGMINGGVRYNIIPDRVTLVGTVRTLDEALRDRIEKKLEEIAASITGLAGGSYEFVYERGCGVLINDDASCLKVEKACRKLDIPFSWADKPMLLAEDFGQYLKQIKGAYFWLGTRNEEKECVYSLHHPRFDLDEAVLLQGARLFAKIVEDYLKEAK